MHCKYLPVVPYNALEKFSKALYGTTGGTYSARVFRPVMIMIQDQILTVQPMLRIKSFLKDLIDENFLLSYCFGR